MATSAAGTVPRRVSSAERTAATATWLGFLASFAVVALLLMIRGVKRFAQQIPDPRDDGEQSPLAERSHHYGSV